VNNWKVIPTIVFATVLIFGAGVFTGGILVNLVKPSHGKKNSHLEVAAVTNSASPMPTNAVTKSNARLPEILSRPFLQRLDEELHLAPDEREAIQKIINEGQNQMRKVIQDSRLEIRELLTPEQRKQFDDLVKRPLHKPILNTNTVVILPPANASSASVAATNVP
jgi:Spy/CpxP family protein refolding chaperone